MNEILIQMDMSQARCDLLNVKSKYTYKDQVYQGYVDWLVAEYNKLVSQWQDTPEDVREEIRGKYAKLYARSLFPVMPASTTEHEALKTWLEPSDWPDNAVQLMHDLAHRLKPTSVIIRTGAGFAAMSVEDMEHRYMWLKVTLRIVRQHAVQSAAEVDNIVAPVDTLDDVLATWKMADTPKARNFREDVVWLVDHGFRCVQSFSLQLEKSCHVKVMDTCKDIGDVTVEYDEHKALWSASFRGDGNCTAYSDARVSNAVRQVFDRHVKPWAEKKRAWFAEEYVQEQRRREARVEQRAYEAQP